MSSILTTGCLMILRLMIAVTDMILDNMKSVVESMIQNKNGHQIVIEEAPETDYMQSEQSSGFQHSNILEAFNLRRSNFPRYAQRYPFQKFGILHKKMKREKNDALPLDMFSELRVLDNTPCGAKSDNETWFLHVKSGNCLSCDCNSETTSLPNDFAAKVEIKPTSREEELVQLEPAKAIEFRKISTSKINRTASSHKTPTLCPKDSQPIFKNSKRSLLVGSDALNKKRNPLSSYTFPSMEDVLKHTEVQQPSDSEPLLQIKRNKGNGESDKDCAGFGYCSDVKPNSSTTTTKRLNSFASSPVKKDNWSLMMKLVDFKFLEKPILECREQTVQQKCGSLGEIVTQNSVENMDFYLGNSSQPKDNALPSNCNRLPTCVPTSDKHDVESNLESIGTTENGKSNFLSSLESTIDENFLKLQNIGQAEFVHVDLPENEALISSEDEHSEEPAKLFDGLENILSQFDWNKNSSSLKSAAKNENIFHDNVSLKDLDTEKKQLKFVDIFSESLLQRCRTNLRLNENEKMPSLENDLPEEFVEYRLLMEEYIMACKKKMNNLKFIRCVSTTDKDEESTLECIGTTDNSKSNFLNNLESGRDNNSLKLKNFGKAEYLHENVPEKKSLASFEDKQSREPKKLYDDSENPKPQSSWTENASSLKSVAQNGNVFRDCNVSIKHLNTEEKQLKFLDILSAHLLQKYVNILHLNENESLGNDFLQEFDEYHHLLLGKYTMACKKQMAKTEAKNKIKSDGKSLETHYSKFITSEIPSEEACLIRTCSESNVRFADSLTDEELDDFGIPIFTDELPEYIRNIDRETLPLHDRCNKDVGNKSIDVIETENDFRETLNSSFDVERHRNDTSTPIPEEKCQESCLEFSNLSLELLNEFKEAILDTRENLTKDSCLISLEHDLNKIVRGKESKMTNVRDLTGCLPESMDEDLFENSSIIEDKDWEECTAEVSKHFDECLSFLDKIEDSDEMDIFLEDSVNSNASSENISNKNRVQVDITSIDHLLRPGEMDVASMLKKPDEAFFVPIDQSALQGEENKLIVSSNYGDTMKNTQSLAVGERLETGKLKNLFSIANGLRKESESENNHIVMTVTTFDEKTVNSASVEQVSPSTTKNKICNVAPIPENDNDQMSKLISPTPICNGSTPYALNNVQKSNEEGVSLIIKDVLPAQNDDLRTDQVSKKVPSTSSNDVCNGANTAEVDNGLVSESLVSSIHSICDYSTSVDKCTRTVENIVKQCATLSLIEEVQNYEDNTENNIVELKELVLPQSLAFTESNVAAIHDYPAYSEQVSLPVICNKFTTMDNPETIIEKMAEQVPPTLFEDVLTLERNTDASQVLERFPNDACPIVETIEVENDLVDKDAASPQSTICDRTTLIYNAGNDIQEIFEHGSSTLEIGGVVPIQKNVEDCSLQISGEPVSPPSPTNFACSDAETAEVCYDLSDLVSQSCVYKEPVTCEESITGDNSEVIVEDKAKLVETASFNEELLTKSNSDQVIKEPVFPLFSTNDVYTFGENVEVDNDLVSKNPISPTIVIGD